MRKDSYQAKRNENLWPCRDISREAFIARVWEEGASHYRELPWRNINDPYAVLVSEVMLQQTQVARVEQYWERFLNAFPTIKDLANANTADVLALWQGLGYNRRALGLKRAAEQIAIEGAQTLPETFDELVALPGIGPATAAGIMVFAYEKPAVYLETNVRAVFLFELFPDEVSVPDTDLIPYVADTASITDPRSWNYALLDYGAALKRSGINPSRASAAYTRQSPFEGSRRQKRAELVRIALSAPKGIELTEAKRLLDELEQAAGREPVNADLFEAIIQDLIQEGFLDLQDSSISVAN